MAVQNINYTREDNEKAGEIGIDAAGKSRLNVQTVTPQQPYSQPVKEAPVRLIIEFDEEELTGEMLKISTVWGKAFVSASGNVIKETKQTSEMLTNEADKVIFANTLGPTILRSILNGKVRAMEGFNDKPVFDASGAVITYTQAQESEPPTHDYYGTTE